MPTPLGTIRIDIETRETLVALNAMLTASRLRHSTWRNLVHDETVPTARWSVILTVTSQTTIEEDGAYRLVTGPEQVMARIRAGSADELLRLAQTALTNLS